MVLWNANENYEAVIAGLTSIGYHGALLEREYGFADYLAPQRPQRRIGAAAFGQTPVSYESACIGVACANGTSGRALVNEYRGLGAPVFLEVDASRVTEWLVSLHEDQHEIVQEYPTERIPELFKSRAQFWKPDALLRAKNIGSYRWVQQGNLFAGVLPELEEQIQESLDPLLRDALSRTKKAYRESSGRDANPAHLFKLVFLLLTAKVFHDRRVERFRSPPTDVDDLLVLVGAKYETDPHLLNRQARDTALSCIWTGMDFRNLSVEILSQIWSRTLVDAATRRKLGIHRTSRSIVRYIVDRIPFEHFGDERRIVLEPCCGSGVFLIGAMNVLRNNLFGASASERHQYFVKHLSGLEKDPFGVEISRLSLTLADFPHPGGWDVQEADVFTPGVMAANLQRAGVVLCNPPFEDFTGSDRATAQYSVKKPVELLHRVLDDLHPSGVLGFVLPRNFVDGRGYADIRRRIKERFADIELTVLPDRAFEAAAEVALLIAREPIPHEMCRVTYRCVNDSSKKWASFVTSHQVSGEQVAFMSADQAEDTLATYGLQEVWEILNNHHTLNDVAMLSRGLEWNRPLTLEQEETGNRDVFVRNEPAAGFMLGVPPRAKFNPFEVPSLKYLSIRPEDKRTNAYRLPWASAKVILNKSTRSRGRWRIAAFPDTDGVTCYQTFTAVWPKPDSDVWTLSATLNGPIANAFISTREGKTDNSMEVLGRIPMPYLTAAQTTHLHSLIAKYQRIIARLPDARLGKSAERVLLEIDAIVLDGYHLPPRIRATGSGLFP